MKHITVYIIEVWSVFGDPRLNARFTSEEAEEVATEMTREYASEYYDEADVNNKIEDGQFGAEITEVQVPAITKGYFTSMMEGQNNG